jgi:hypothetical protein
MLSGAVTLDTRYSFTAQFLSASALQAREAFAIEAKPTEGISEEDRTRHRGYVVGAIMQSVAALEAEIWEVMRYGPGHHLGSNGIDAVAREFLNPVADLVDRQDAVSRYATVLHLLHKDAIDAGAAVSENASLVVKLRNEIVHYKSKWGTELERAKLFGTIQAKSHRRPPFQPATGMNFFPHHCLSAECAAWAVESCAGYITLFYNNLGIPSPLANYADRLKTRPE